MPHTIKIYTLDDLINVPPQTTHLEVFLADDNPVTAATLALLPSGLRSLRVKSITADALATLPERSPGLEALRLHIDGLGAEGLAPLARLAHLRTVELTARHEPLPDLSPIASASALKVMVNADLEAFIAQLPKLAALKVLKTWSFPLFEARHMQAIAAMPALEELRLGGNVSRVTHALTGLQAAPALRILGLEDCSPLSAQECVALARIATLERAGIRASAADDLLAARPLHDKVARLLVMVGTNKANDDAFLHALVDNLPDVAILNVMALPNRGRSGVSCTATGLARLGELKRLTWLNLGYLAKEIKPADLAWLTCLPALQHLIVSGAGMSAKLADVLSGCAALRTLELSQVKLSDAAVKKLGGLKLEGLKLTETPMTDKGLATLGQIKTLQRLSLEIEKGQLGDAGLQALGGLPDLRELYITLNYKSPYTATTLAPLAKIPTLERLRLEPLVPSVDTPGGIASLAGAPALWHIELGYASQGPLDEACAAALKTLPSLRVVGGITANHALLRGHALATTHLGYTPVVVPYMSTMI